MNHNSIIGGTKENFKAVAETYLTVISMKPVHMRGAVVGVGVGEWEKK